MQYDSPQPYDSIQPYNVQLAGEGPAFVAVARNRSFTAGGSMTDTEASPATFEMSVTEVQTLTFDASPDLLPGETISAFSSSVLRIANGLTSIPAAEPTINGNVITQMISGPSDLQDVGLWRLRIHFTTSLGDAFDMDLTITAVA
jgi:hypothetical protein